MITDNDDEPALADYNVPAHHIHTELHQLQPAWVPLYRRSAPAAACLPSLIPKNTHFNKLSMKYLVQDRVGVLKT